MIIKRYDALAEEAESKGELMTLKQQVNTYENLLSGKLSDETQEVLIKWTEVHNHMATLQKHGSTLKGFKMGYNC